jgi:carbon-monoxide dehydrogenase large subunit
MDEAAKPEKFGAFSTRAEDPRLLRGEGCYASDLARPDMLVAAVYRSPVAHARILAVNVEAARSSPGVVAVFVAKDLGSAQMDLPSFGQFPKSLIEQWKPTIRFCPVRTLADTKVRYVGEPVALVVAKSRALAEDALDLIDFEFEQLNALTTVEAASAADATKLFDEHPDNVALDLKIEVGDAAAAFAGAETVVSDTFNIQRYSGMPLEGRSVFAIPSGDGLMIWTTQQLPHFARALVCKALGLHEHQVHVKQPDIGGAFGQKAGLYPEDVLIAFAARALGRPVKWLEDKREQLLSSSHSREQRIDAEMAFDKEGRILGIRYRARIDAGAYLTFPVVLPFIGLCHLFGPYRIPALSADVQSVLTNKTTSAPYRGAGRPEAVFVLNRLIDRAAARLGVDPIDLRFLNLIDKEDLPLEVGVLYRDGNPMLLDSGDYKGALKMVLDAFDYQAFRREQQQARAQGRHLGFGVACNIESGGIGPYESARLKVEPDGKAVLYVGSTDSGQGHKTTFAQICAAQLGLELADITVISGDTVELPFSRGTYHSRGAVATGNAVDVAVLKVKKKLREIASCKLETSAQDLEFEGGLIRVAGTDMSMSIADCVKLAAPELALSQGFEPGVDEIGYFNVPTTAWGNAVHAAAVEVDPDTGAVKILRYVVVHDCGTMINPLLVRGQVHGGIAAGIGGAMLESLVYDPDGNLLTTTLQDYLLPRLHDVPHIELLHMESPSPLNPLGVKGAGEGGTIAPPAVIAAAVEDALSSFGVQISSTPVSPSKVLDALRRAKEQRRHAAVSV